MKLIVDLMYEGGMENVRYQFQILLNLVTMFHVNIIVKQRDLIICSQDFYMDHIWTYDARKREGQIPLLPESSCVVFDEGHLVEYANSKVLTYRLKQTMMEQL